MCHLWTVLWNPVNLNLTVFGSVCSTSGGFRIYGRQISTVSLGFHWPDWSKEISNKNRPLKNSEMANTLKMSGILFWTVFLLRSSVIYWLESRLCIREFSGSNPGGNAFRTTFLLKSVLIVTFVYKYLFLNASRKKNLLKLKPLNQLFALGHWAKMPSMRGSESDMNKDKVFPKYGKNL